MNHAITETSLGAKSFVLEAVNYGAILNMIGWLILLNPWNAG